MRVIVLKRREVCHVEGHGGSGMVIGWNGSEKGRGAAVDGGCR